MGQNSTKQPVKREDLYAFHFLSDPVLSPDGVWAAYTEAQADEESNGYKNRVWVRNLKTEKTVCWRPEAARRTRSGWTGSRCCLLRNGTRRRKKQKPLPGITGFP